MMSINQSGVRIPPQDGIKFQCKSCTLRLVCRFYVVNCVWCVSGSGIKTNSLFTLIKVCDRDEEQVCLFNEFHLRWSFQVKTEARSPTVPTLTIGKITAVGLREIINRRSLHRWSSVGSQVELVSISFNAYERVLKAIVPKEQRYQWSKVFLLKTNIENSSSSLCLQACCEFEFGIVLKKNPKHTLSFF